MSNNQFVEVTPLHTHLVVLSNKRLVIQVADAESVMINGILLTSMSAEKHLWVWHTQRRVGRHLLAITRVTHIQIVMVECIADSAYQDVVMLLREQLAVIDERLCMGQSAWHTIGINNAVFTSLMGMSIETLLQDILRYLQAPPAQTLQEWQGDSHTPLRIDRVVMHDSTLVPLAYQAHTQQRRHEAIALLLQVLQALEQDAEYQVVALINHVRQRLLTPVHITQGLVDVVARTYAALEQSQRPTMHGGVQHTADVALLYERWVWVTVLRALGCSDAQMRQLIDGNAEFCSDAGVMCAYQRRLATTPNVTGWSRDGRMAIPDVMLWQLTDTQTWRACIIDAKCSFDVNGPDHAAQNDVTAYLRRIGMGDVDPDAAVLVHPGTGIQSWPSGLIELGTDGANAEQLSQFVQAWVKRQI